ncbi:MAG: acetyl-CoA carboxylase biotin carboxyl carrier protein subunit [Alphaproteobacteria bacterium]|jgi:biotin carboxyl carrier protein|nr:acetyl-CoA carboxylase biotin carboxyl carrier protein subunit [Alphaproteobacteria bacterium]
MARRKVTSDVTGMIRRLEVAPGASVAAGDTILIMESMKMEIPVAAPAAGIVRDFHVDEEAFVQEGQLLATLETSD